ncbi:hypothetical protein [Anatilimnocola floriformis]|uniref:hypothetical protein n=1 Tax=Anatilimnocola floriformis TaxID=2948575 RepID=UPI0020C383DF|nr:hypothetical protein [Anatilimnocola floriformis]
MNQFAWLAGLACCLCSLTAHAEDFLLRLDTVVSIDSPKTDKPIEKRTHRFEILARLDTPFFYHDKAATETQKISGELRRNEKGDFYLKIRYFHSQPAPPLDPPAVNSPTDETSFTTSVALPLEKEVTMAEFLKDEIVDKVNTQTALRVIASVRKFEAEKDP